MTLTETLLFLLVIIAGGIFANIIIEMRELEKEIKRLKKERRYRSK